MKDLIITKEDIHAYLEYKIYDGAFSDEEYDFYIDIRDYGFKAFRFNIHKKAIKRLKNEYKDYYEGN